MSKAKEVIDKLEPLGEVSRRDIDAAFLRWLRASGRRLAKDYKDVGGYRISKDATGYKVERVANKEGGVVSIGKRFKAKDFMLVLDFAEDDRRDKK